MVASVKKKPATPGAKGAKGAAATGEPAKTTEMQAATTPPRALVFSLKSKKGGRQLEVTVQIPRSTPNSVLNIDADEAGLRVNTGKWGGGYAMAVEWPAPFTGKVRAGKDVEVGFALAQTPAGLCTVSRDWRCARWKKFKISPSHTPSHLCTVAPCPPAYLCRVRGNCIGRAPTKLRAQSRVIGRFKACGWF